MKQKQLVEYLKLATRTARVYLWPLITVNVVCIWVYLGRPPGGVVSLAVGLCLLASFGFILNDLWDREVDRHNKAGRLERATPRECRAMQWLAIGCLVSAGLLMARLGTRGLVLFVLMAIGLSAYTLLLRSAPLIAAALAASMTAVPLWGPAFLWPKATEPFYLIALSGACIMLMGREILLDVKDVRGDLAAGRRTIPTLFGERIALVGMMTLVVLGSLILVTGAIVWKGPVTIALCFLVAGMMALPSLAVLARSSPGATRLAINCSRVAMATLALVWLAAS